MESGRICLVRKTVDYLGGKGDVDLVWKQVLIMSCNWRGVQYSPAGSIDNKLKIKYGWKAEEHACLVRAECYLCDVGWCILFCSISARASCASFCLIFAATSALQSKE